MIHTDGVATIANRIVETDIEIRREGSLFLVCPLSTAGKDWIIEHVDGEAQWFGSSLVVEHRYIEELFDGMVDDGLRVR